MKTYIGIITITLLLSCNIEKEPLQNSQEYYANLLKKKLVENGIKNTEYFEIDAENIDIENLNHDEIISKINKVIPILKKEYEKSLIALQNAKKSNVSKQELGDDFTKKELSLLIKTVKQHNLEHKEPFYQKLLSLESNEEQVALYVSELNVFKNKMMEASGNLRLAAKIQENYAYLNVIAKDQNGDKVSLDLINDENISSIKFTIKKYDPDHIEVLKNVKWADN